MRSSRSPSMSAAMRIAESPRYAPSKSGERSKPVSARKLAATLWEMNEVPSPSPRVMDRVDEKRIARVRRHSGSFPPHLSDPSHSPVSEKMERSGTGSRHRRASSISQKFRNTDHSVGVLDSLSSASLMEIETRSRAQTPSGSTAGVRTRLKDVSNALMTSKELLKIINRIWGHEDRPSSSMSLISALHAELERGRLQVNQMIQEQRSDQNEINYLMKCFAEEKAAWKRKEQEGIEAAIESIAGELEVERKLRRRFESLNKKLGKELAETKAYFLKTVKELENEKRAREIMEQVCDELAQDIGEDKAGVEELKRESAKVLEEVEKEKEMLQLANVLREERVQMKLSETKHQSEEKNAAVEKLKNELGISLRTKKSKERGSSSLHHGNNALVAAYLSKNRYNSHYNDDKDDDGEVEDAGNFEEDSAESDLHSIELNMDNNHKSYKWTHTLGPARDSRKFVIDEDEMKGRRSTSGRVVPRQSSSLQRSVSDGVEWNAQTESLQNAGYGLDWGGISEYEKHAQRKDYSEEMQRYKTVKGLKDRILSNAIVGNVGVLSSPTRQWGQMWPSRDIRNAVQDRPPTGQGSNFKSRLAEVRGEVQNARRSKC